MPVLEHPDWLGPLAAILGLAVVAWARSTHATRSRVARLLGDTATPRSLPGRDGGAIVLALLALAVALLGPRIGRAPTAPAQPGVDLVLLLDLSRSMDAGDVAPSRLHRAIATAETLLPLLDAGDRVALAGFAGRGALLAPLTPDRRVIAEMLRRLDTTLLRPGGSELDAGLARAVEAFEEASDRPRTVLVLSDGEPSDPEGALGIEAARRADARVLAIGVGTEPGARIPDGSGPLHDAAGRPVVTRRSLRTLERLTGATGGATYAADAWGEVDAGAVAAAIDRFAAPVPASGAGPDAPPRTRPVALAWPFAAFAAAALVAESLAGAAAARRRARARARRLAPGRPAVASLAAALALVGIAAPAMPAGSPEDAQARRLLRSGLARAHAGETRDAAEALAAAAVLAVDPALVAMAEYDLGVLALDRGDLAAARDHFLAALVFAPRDHRARFNAEWTLRALAARAPDPPPARPGGEAREEGADEPRERRAPEAGRADVADAAPDAAAETEPGSPRIGGAAPGAATPPATAPLDEGERARWLERVDDDLARALELNGREAGRAPVRAPRMTW